VNAVLFLIEVLRILKFSEMLNYLPNENRFVAVVIPKYGPVLKISNVHRTVCLMPSIRFALHSSVVPGYE
jgi:hypothetical protein